MRKIFARCKPLIEAGAKQGLSPSDVVQHCDIVFSCVSDADAVRDVSIALLFRGFKPGLHEPQLPVERSVRLVLSL